jgi:hypothetical protein
MERRGWLGSVSRGEHLIRSISELEHHPIMRHHSIREVEPGLALERCGNRGVPSRYMGQEEALHPRGFGNLGSLGGGGMVGIARPRGLVSGKGRIMNEHLSPLRDLDRGWDRPRIARQNHTATRARGPHEFRRSNDPPGDLDGLPPVKTAKQRTFRNPERPGALDIETPRTGIFNEGIPKRGDPMLNAIGLDSVIVERQRFTVSEFTDRNRKSRRPTTEVNQ